MPREQRWTTEDEKLTIKMLRREGKSRRAIHKETGIPVRTVERVVKKYEDLLKAEAQDKLNGEHVDRLMTPFRFPEDIGNGDHQVPMSHAEYALDAYDFYLTNYGVKPMLGLGKHYALIAAVRPNMVDLDKASYPAPTHEHDRPEGIHPFDVAQAALFAEMYWYADLVELVGGDPRPDTEWVTFNIIARSTRWPDKEYLSPEEKAEKQGLKRFDMPTSNRVYFKHMPSYYKARLDYWKKVVTELNQKRKTRRQRHED